MKGVRILQPVDKFAAFAASVGVEHHGVDLPDVGVDSVPEQSHLQDGNNQGKEEGGKVPSHVQDFLVKHRAATAKDVSHWRPPKGIRAGR
jgi:hypothetical protein